MCHDEDTLIDANDMVVQLFTRRSAAPPASIIMVSIGIKWLERGLVYVVLMIRMNLL